MGNTNAFGHRLSVETKAKISAVQIGQRVGPLNWNWKGGITPENVVIRHSHEYVVWRTAVFERDAYTCQDCGARNGNGHAVFFEAHHIHGFAKYPEERFVVDNGKTLCLECHNKTKRGRPLFAEAQP